MLADMPLPCSRAIKTLTPVTGLLPVFVASVYLPRRAGASRQAPVSLVRSDAVIVCANPDTPN